MGNNQSNPQEYTPEQYKQLLEYQEQQRRAAVFQTNTPLQKNTPLHINQQSVPSQQCYINPVANEKGQHQNNVNYVNQPNYTQVNNSQLTNNRANSNNANYNENNNNVNVAYNNQQIRRTQIKPELNNLDKKLIPDLQQKKYTGDMYEIKVKYQYEKIICKFLAKKMNSKKLILRLNLRLKEH